LDGREARVGDMMVPRESVERLEDPELPDDSARSDRRRDIRHLTILRVGAVIIDGRRELCLVRNISAGGLMSLIYSKVEIGQRLAVELKTNQEIAGRVSWVRGTAIGVEFDERIDVPEVLSTPAVLDNGWRPRMPRIPVDRLATLRAGARTYWVNARDISQGGVKVEAEKGLEIGAETVVTLENFRPVQGVVRWRRDNEAGISFNQIIPFNELTGWLTQS
jgi:hypothetical protein